jgi:hypothetical protein
MYIYQTNKYLYTKLKHDKTRHSHNHKTETVSKLVMNHIFLKGNHFLSHQVFIFLYRVMVFNATLNNILVILWRSVLLVEETGVPRENHRPVAGNSQTLSHNIVLSTPRLSGIRTHNISGDRH